MKLTLIGHEDRYAVEQLQMALFAADSPVEAVSTLSRGKVWLTAATRITYNGKTARASRRLPLGEETVALRRRLLQQSYYRAAVQLLPQLPAWGALAGVRPTKLSTRHLLEGGTPASAQKLLQQVYYVTPPRAKLAADCSGATVKTLGLLSPEDISVYVGIPFCPTRCSYCSFVSRTVSKHGGLIEPYLKALLAEIALTGKLLESSGKQVRTIYIGGGTPTTLTTGQLQQLLSAIRDSFDLSRCLEFTVEGGRPDTLDLEKLTALRQGGADRMSINPQTMEDPVLQACGRPHTARDVEQCYHFARQAQFGSINMDLIAGLPADSYDGFRRSLNAVALLRPDNITVHTLALKKGADLFERRENLCTPAEVTRMVEYANRALPELGYKPYYLYRQKYMSGSFENVGWSLPGQECHYNICMMEELHSIVSLGGGGMNKVNLPDGTLQRFHNPKFPEQYIDMIDSVLADKRKLFALL